MRRCRRDRERDWYIFLESERVQTYGTYPRRHWKKIIRYHGFGDVVGDPPPPVVFDPRNTIYPQCNHLKRYVVYNVHTDCSYGGL
jgi:hypothetical protein